MVDNRQRRLVVGELWAHRMDVYKQVTDSLPPLTLFIVPIFVTHALRSIIVFERPPVDFA